MGYMMSYQESDMSVCKYYLRGNCRYGNECRFLHEKSHQPRFPHPPNPPFRPRHPINPEFRYVAPTNHQSDASHQRNYKFADVFKWVKENFSNGEKALDILVELQNEAKAWQKSDHLWRFTSRSLFPGGQPLEGWHDQSFEEISWTYRTFKSQNQEHVYKKAYYDYYENTVRQLNELALLKLDRLKLMKDHIHQYVESHHKPSKTYPTDIEMRDVSDNTMMQSNPQIQSFPATQSTNYTPDDQLLEDERAAFQSDRFEFGQIPVQAPPRQYC